eukprot:11113743-Prorocentrum_lima.AAC.1
MAIQRSGHAKGDQFALSRARGQNHAPCANFGHAVAALSASGLVVPPSLNAQAVQLEHGRSHNSTIS